MAKQEQELEFERLLDRIQGEVFDEARIAFGDKGFERWRNPRYCGVLAEPDGQAELRGSCGDRVTIYLKVAGERLSEVSYTTDGCGASGVAASFTAQLAIGRGFAEVLAMTGADVLRELGTFPREEEHCAQLAVATLQKALHGYLAARGDGRSRAAKN
jgi:nitrogen fixation protein NifU and related proteins